MLNSKNLLILSSEHREGEQVFITAAVVTAFMVGPSPWAVGASKAPLALLAPTPSAPSRPRATPREPSSSPTVAKSVPVATDSQSNKSAGKSLWECLTDIAQILSGGAAVVAICISVRALKSTSKSSERQLRAYLGISKAEIERGNPYKAWLEICNFGSTPATNVSVITRHLKVDGDWVEWQHNFGMIDPGVTERAPVHLCADWRKTFERNGNWRIAVTIEYEDSFKKRWIRKTERYTNPTLYASRLKRFPIDIVGGTTYERQDS